MGVGIQLGVRLAVIILQKGPWSAAAATRAAQLGAGSLGVPLAQHAAPEPAGRNSL